MMIVADRRAHIDLLEAYRTTGDRAARDRLVEEMMPLVHSLARRYAGRGEPVDDLVQVGAIGLIKAIDRFELDRGVELSTYAVPTIVGEIRRHFRDRSWSVHVPRRMKELSLRVSRLVDDLSAELGRAPTVAELAEAADVEEEDVVEALETARAHTPASLSTPVDASGELTLIDLIGDDEAGYEALERGSVVRTGLEGLEERERRIVILRFLKGMTQSEIAAELDISQMHVSRLLRRALAAMHGRIDDGDGMPL
jgi:RNA polymerase sigma-B factor